MSYLGSWKIDDALTFAANSHDPSDGSASDADTVPTYRVYEDETGTAILNGSTAKLDDANTTGFYSEQLTLSAANGFEKGKCYTIYVSATVGSVVVTTNHTFQVEAEVDVQSINANATAAARLALSADQMIPGTVDNTAFTPTTTQLEADDITTAAADHYNGRIIIFTSGTLIAQATDITDYELSTGRGKFTYTAVTSAPANNDTFIIV